MSMVDPQNAEERRRRQKIKNWAMLAALVIFVVVVYFTAIVRMGSG